MNHKKLSAYIFIFGALIAILSASFALRAELEGIRYLILIIIGIALGMINYNDSDDMPFLISSAVFVIGSLTIVPFMAKYEFIETISYALINLVVLVTPISVILALKHIVLFSSRTEHERFYEKTKEMEHEALSGVQKVWHTTVVIAFSLALIVLVLRIFFDVTIYDSYITVVDYVIIGIFAVDLAVLFHHSKDIHYFLHNHWLDIVAVIPLGFVFRVAKIARYGSIIRSFSSSSELTSANFVSRATFAVGQESTIIAGGAKKMDYIEKEKQNSSNKRNNKPARKSSVRKK